MSAALKTLISSTYIFRIATPLTPGAELWYNKKELFFFFCMPPPISSSLTKGGKEHISRLSHVLRYKKSEVFLMAWKRACFFSQNPALQLQNASFYFTKKFRRRDKNWKLKTNITRKTKPEHYLFKESLRRFGPKIEGKRQLILCVRKARRFFFSFL